MDEAFPVQSSPQLVYVTLFERFLLFLMVMSRREQINAGENVDDGGILEYSVISFSEFLPFPGH